MALSLYWLPQVIGTPWVLRGRDPVGGWDCLGCGEVGQARALGTPEINSLALYASDPRSLPSSMLAAHFEAGVSAYRKLEVPLPGALIVFRLGRRPVHCGLYLGHGRFLHASQRAGTIISTLTDHDYASTASDAYFPAAYSGG